MEPIKRSASPSGTSGNQGSSFPRGRNRRYNRDNKPFRPQNAAYKKSDGRPTQRPVEALKPTSESPTAVNSLIAKAIARNGKKPEPSLKEGFKREEKAGKSHGRRPGGRMSSNVRPPRLNTYKFKPYLKTGSDTDKLKSRPEERLKIIVLGGNEEVGRNMTMIEYGKDIIILDMGFQFPEDDMPGVDYIIPNISYLKGKEKNIRGVIITHGHLDHIGGIPYLIPRLGNPPIFTSDLTGAIIKKRQDDFRGTPPLNVHTVGYNDVLQLGVFKLEFFGVAHSIPSSMGVIVNTPCGIVVHTGDFKLDPAPGAQSLQETTKIMKLGERGVLALMIDSTNAWQPGRQLPEYEIQHNIDEIIANAQGKVIIGTFSSMIARIQQIIMACERQGRKVAVEGFSMKSNIMIAQELGYVKVQKGTLIETKEIHKYPPNKVAVVCTGAQGEDRAALMRIATREHPIVEIEPGDTVVFSSSVIPGNERSVQRVKDTLYREGANVIHYQMMDVHAGGHAKQEDVVQMHKMIKPKYLIPIEGHYSFLVEHAKGAVNAGFDQNNVMIADNGQIMEFDRQGNGQLTNKKVPTEYVFVDGLGVGDTNHIVLRDRQELAGDGVVVVLAVVSGKTGRLMQMPDLISRGFVYMKEQGELMRQASKKVSEILSDKDPRSGANGTFLKDKVRDDLGMFLFKKTERRPMILPIIVEV